MIGFLKGVVVRQSSSLLLVETGGVGYEAHVPPPVSSKYRAGDRLSLWIYTCVRQDSLELYGFEKPLEKELFLSLLKVKGIGPKMALGLLGACSLESFSQMIRSEDIKALSALPKIGKKTAQQIVLSLKDTIADRLPGAEGQTPHRDQLFFALESLGFQTAEIRRALDQTQESGDLKKDIARALVFLKSR